MQTSFRREKEGAVRVRNNYSYEDYTTVSPETRKPPPAECKGVTIRVPGKSSLKTGAGCSYITLRKCEGRRVARADQALSIERVRKQIEKVCRQRTLLQKHTPTPCSSDYKEPLPAAEKFMQRVHSEKHALVIRKQSIRYAEPYSDFYDSNW